MIYIQHQRTISNLGHREEELSRSIEKDRETFFFSFPSFTFFRLSYIHKKEESFFFLLKFLFLMCILLGAYSRVLEYLEL